MKNEEYIREVINFFWLLAVVYDGYSQFYSENKFKAKIKFYDDETESIVLYEDDTRHRPFLLTDVEEIPKSVMNHREFIGYKRVIKIDRLFDKTRKLKKIFTKTPLGIGGKNGIRDKIKGRVWEARIKYIENYIYDRKLVPGMAYRNIEDDYYITFDHDESITNDIHGALKNETESFMEWLPHYLDCYLTPIPNIKRCALDIEVAEEMRNDRPQMPNPTAVREPVISACIATSDGKAYKFLNKEVKEPVDDPSVIYTTEENLIKSILRICNKYPITLTFNGDGFDLRYLLNRIKKLDKHYDPPLQYDTDNIAHFENSVHIDLQMFLQQAAIQNYAFKKGYKSVSLEATAQFLCKMGKIKHEELVKDLPSDRLIEYNWMDAFLTLYMTQVMDQIVMRLIFLAMRINKTEIMFATRKAATTWLANRFNWVHRFDNILIPNKDDIKGLKGKAQKKGRTGAKFEGAVILEPIPGIHWNAVLLDFTSSYATIIKTYNLSYETIKCKHEECTEKFPITGYQVCRKYDGIIATHIALDLTLRKNFFKPMSKKDKSFSPIEQFIKVEVNMSWGIFGHENFDYYCEPAAECVAAGGRHNVLAIKKEAEYPSWKNKMSLLELRKQSCRVLYGHTDSIMVHNPSEEMIDHICEYSLKELGVELDVESRLRYAALTTRKANYFAVEDNGDIIIKGLSGKKANTPKLFRDLFSKVTKMLGRVQNKKQLEEAKRRFVNGIKSTKKKIRTKKVNLEDMTVNITMARSIDTYVNSDPQHVKAARQLVEMGYEVRAGDVISFVKCSDDVPRPIEIATVEDINVVKYEEQLQTVVEPLMEPLGLTWKNDIKGQGKLIE